jgi:LmbE family N-acetylglucosaminyl deacetylase
MLGLKLNLEKGRAPCLLFIGAHSDDIEIGCGGTVIELLKTYPKAVVYWVVLSSGSTRTREAKQSSRAILRGMHNSHVIIKDFRECIFPSLMIEIKQFFEEMKRTMTPDVVFAHFREDLHQDHRVVGELVWNTFRDHIILEYEIPKFDGGLGSPSVFMPISRAAMKRKIAILMKAFPSQHNKPWFTPETFQGLMRLRGIECNSPSGFAEAFYSRKLTLSSAVQPNSR